MTAPQAWRSAWRDARNRRAGRNTSGRHSPQVAHAAQRALDVRETAHKEARAAELVAMPLLPLILKRRRRRGGGAPPALVLPGALERPAARKLPSQQEERL